MELTMTQQLILGRLTEDQELLAVLRAIDADRQEFYLRTMIEETQSAAPNIHYIIQLASKLAERREGVNRYCIEAKKP